MLHKVSTTFPTVYSWQMSMQTNDRSNLDKKDTQKLRVMTDMMIA